MLKIEHLTKRFGDKVAVHDLTLEVEPGEIMGFLGHNGAGKTTTLKQIVTLLPIEEGSIEVNGINVAKEPRQAKAQLAYIPDNPDLLEYMTAIKYLEFIAAAYGYGANDLRDNIMSLAKEFEIEDRLNERLSGFSHGMKQKVALISAFMHSPKLILLDEPFVGLDPASSFKLKRLMHKHCEDGGAIFFSTHVLDVAEKLCDRLAIIRHGELVRVGEVSEIVGSESLEEVFLELEEEKDASEAQQ